MSCSNYYIFIIIFIVFIIIILLKTFLKMAVWTEGFLDRMQISHCKCIIQSWWLCGTELSPADKFIICFSQHQALFDKWDANYKNNNLKENMRESVADFFGSGDVVCKGFNSHNNNCCIFIPMSHIFSKPQHSPNFTISVLTAFHKHP